MNSPNLLPNWCLPKPKLYLAKYPNQPILLYKGFAEVIQGKNIVEGNATVLWVWFPYPHAKFEFINFSDTKVELDDLTLKLKEKEVSALAHVSEKTYTTDSKDIISGYFCEPVIQGKGEKLASLVFYIPNFPFFNISNTWEIDEEGQEQELEGWLGTFFEGEFVFQTEDWRVILATLPDSWDIHQQLHSLGGYAMTHICKLERVDKNQFSVNDTHNILKAFSYYLSFAKGQWIAPILLLGYDVEGKQVFEEWSDCRADSWQDTNEWFSVDSTELVKAFPGFMRKWQNKTWQEILEKSVYWYVESSKQAGGVEGAIVLQQAALERLAWVFLVKEKRTLVEDEFKRLPAAEVIRQLLSFWKISLDIPQDFTNLIHLSKQFNWADGPHSITATRNAIVHPNSKNYYKSKLLIDTARYEAWCLGLQYLELLLLKLFDYPYAYLYNLEQD